MSLPINVYLSDHELENISSHVSKVCLSPEFEDLRKELFVLYNRCGAQNAKKQAFEDTLYALLAENDNSS